MSARPTLALVRGLLGHNPGVNTGPLTPVLTPASACHWCHWSCHWFVCHWLSLVSLARTRRRRLRPLIQRALVEVRVIRRWRVCRARRGRDPARPAVGHRARNRARVHQRRGWRVSRRRDRSGGRWRGNPAGTAEQQHARNYAAELARCGQVPEALQRVAVHTPHRAVRLVLTPVWA
jgi:hypothetical protein